MRIKTHIVLYLFISTFVYSQNQDTTFEIVDGSTFFGIKAGINQSNYYGKDIGSYFASSKTTPLLGFHIGIAANSELSKHFWLKHELLLTQKGAGVSLKDSTNPIYSTKLKVYSLDLFPLNFTYHQKGFQIFAGPFASMVVAANIKRKNEAGAFFNDKTIYGDSRQFEDTSKYLQKLDYGITVGLEYEFNTGFLVGARYVRGFAEVLDYANKNTLHDAINKYRFYNQYFSISVGYSFRRKSK